MANALHNKAIHVAPNFLSFAMFTNEEVRKLAVMKITTPLTFDALGHPLPNGLCDKALGKCQLNV